MSDRNIIPCGRFDRYGLVQLRSGISKLHEKLSLVFLQPYLHIHGVRPALFRIIGSLEGNLHLFPLSVVVRLLRLPGQRDHTAVGSAFRPGVFFIPSPLVCSTYRTRHHRHYHDQRHHHDHELLPCTHSHTAFSSLSKNNTSTRFQSFPDALFFISSSSARCLFMTCSCFLISPRSSFICSAASNLPSAPGSLRLSVI